GKLNMHEYALSITNDNPHFGPVRNPWKKEKISGGSSGGSAASVAVGSTPVSIGTDTAGSIRIPAAACGVVGLKPTRGVVSEHGRASCRERGELTVGGDLLNDQQQVVEMSSTNAVC